MIVSDDQPGGGPRIDSYERGSLTFDVGDTGPRDGEVVVLLHGFPQRPSCWDRVLPHLHARGLRSLVPQLRGYGPTARPPGRRSYRLRQLLDDVVRLVDVAGQQRVHLVGHDWGAVLGWALAARLPTRVRTLTVLSVPHPDALFAALLRSSQAVRSSYIAFFQLPALPELVLRHGLASILSRSGLPAEDVSAYCTSMLDPGARTAALNWYRALPLSRGVGIGPIQVPTTYVWGRDDFAVGRVAALGAERFVVAPYRFVELDAGHWLPETRSAEVAQAVLDRATAIS